MPAGRPVLRTFSGDFEYSYTFLPKYTKNFGMLLYTPFTVPATDSPQLLYGQTSLSNLPGPPVPLSF